MARFARFYFDLVACREGVIHAGPVFYSFSFYAAKAPFPIVAEDGEEIVGAE
jgi:hypothetical protein